jgi:mono/diheme cytochrome c family protein
VSFWSKFVVRPRLSIAAATIATAITAFAGISITALATISSPSSGHDVFMQSGCFACHGELGYGGAGPRFRGDKLLAADQYVVGQILLGRGIMPSFAHRLNDEQIAAVATYVRNSWGNNFGPVSVEDVTKGRKQFLQSPPNGQDQTSGEQK